MPPHRDESLPPVPPDAADGSVISTSQLPWAAIPRFQPGTTNVQEYVKKMEFLAAMWPVEHLELLAPRAALMVEGSAFAAISKLDPSKLKVKSLDGVKTLVKAIGGSWGATDFEECFGFFERALYGTIQKQDESNDSFIARMENVFSELLSRKTSLEEIQAYVLLRQSTLPADDKKRVLLENPQLSYQPVLKALRLLGSKFFQEVQAGKPSSKTKVYDTLIAEDNKDYIENSCLVSQTSFTEDDEMSPEFLDAMVSQDDPDAVTIQTFETEFDEFLQETPSMHTALVSYLEARQRLQDKRRGRGFWPANGAGKAKGKSKHGGKGKRDRQQGLLQKIAKSRCRICDQIGHWKAECPERLQRSNNAAPPTSSPPASAAANVVEPEMPTTADGEMQPDDDAEIFTDADLMMQVPPMFSELFTCVQECFMVVSDKDVQDCFMSVHNVWNTPQNRMKLSQYMSKMPAVQKQQHKQVSGSRCPMPSAPAECTHVQNQHPPQIKHASHVNQPRMPEKLEYLPEMAILQSSEEKPAHAILDIGASRCIIGSQPLSRLLQRLPPDVRSTVQQRNSKIKFRFGNNQTLTSMYRILLPLHGPTCEKVWLGVEVVNGATPFLFSKRAFKQLGGILDTNTDTCHLRRLQKTIELSTNSTGLYLIDMSDFCQPHPEDNRSCPEVFVGNASHVGENTYSTHDTKLCTGWTTLPIRKFPCSQDVHKPLNSSVEQSTTSINPTCPNVESRSSHPHAEGDSQHDHGHLDPPTPSLHEDDRSSQPRCSRGRDHATADQSASSHVSGDDESTCPSATFDRESTRADSNELRTGPSSLAGAREWNPECTAPAHVSLIERRGRSGTVLHGVISAGTQ